MTPPPDATPVERQPLTRERILECAIAVAVGGGLGSLTIRSLAAELGVKPMSVYHHVPNKEAILDGMVDAVFAAMRLPDSAGSADDWRSEIVRRAHATRRVLRTHTWAIGLLESRSSPGPATLRHRDETIGILRRAGFGVEATAHAYALLDSFVYGFALQEASRPFGAAATDAREGREGDRVDAVDGDAYPHLVEMAEMHRRRPDYDFGDEFQVGLDLILDAVTRSGG
jgi:AcrR family transcriptional regulator